MFGALSLVVASAGSCLVQAAPVGPVVGVVLRVCSVGQCRPQAADFVAGQGDQVFVVRAGAPFSSWMRSRCAVTARNTAASIERVMCRYHAG
jgi:hypothetical protein